MAPGSPRPLTGEVIWTRIVEPRERYRITYRDKQGHLTERNIELQKIGHTPAGPGHGQTEYFGVMHEGRFKTFRVDGVISVIEQLTAGHESSIRPAPSYSSELQPFPLPNAQYRIATIKDPNRRWTVDLNLYTCTCPEKRIRGQVGYTPPQLGAICPHVAKAILENAPPGWLSPELQSFLANPRKVHIDNLTR
jgi:hypothetical protein